MVLQRVVLDLSSRERPKLASPNAPSQQIAVAKPKTDISARGGDTLWPRKRHLPWALNAP